MSAGIQSGLAPLVNATTLSSLRTETWLPDSSATNIEITSTGAVDDTSAPTNYELYSGVEVRSPKGWTFINSGTIKISGEGGWVDADGFWAAFAGTLNNSGIISALNSYAGVYNGNSAGNSRTTVNNSGQILGGWYGIYNSHDLSLINGSTEDRAAKITSSSSIIAGLSVVYAQSASGGFNSITNYGTISGAANGIILNGTSRITNYGVINAGSGYNAIDLKNALTDSWVILGDGSQITGDVRAATSYASSFLPTLSLSGRGSVTGAISGFATLTADGADWTLQGNARVASATVKRGTLSIDGTLSSPVQISDGGKLSGLVTVQGDVRISAGGTLQASRLGVSGHATVDGAYVQDSGATLAVAAEANGNKELTVTGTATLGGALVIDNAAGDYTTGQAYVLLTASGGLSGTFSSVTDTNDALTPILTYDTANSRVLVTFSPTIPRLYWDGGIVGDHGNGTVDGGSGVWSASAENWTDAAGIQVGSQQPVAGSAIFGGQGGLVTVDNAGVSTAGIEFRSGGYELAGGPVTLTDAATSVRVDNGLAANGAGQVTIASTLTGSGGLEKTGAGTLILTGANTYTGTTTIDAGTLQLGSGSSMGSIDSAAGIINNAALVINASGTATLGYQIGGTGAITQSGAGKVVLSAANTYSGGTILKDGTLQLHGTTTTNGANSIISGAAGTGGIAFEGNTSARLIVEGVAMTSGTAPNSYSLAYHLSGFGVGDVVHLANLNSTSATAVYNTNGTLTVQDGTNVDTLTINAAPSGYQYKAVAGATGGVDVVLASVPSNGGSGGGSPQPNPGPTLIDGVPVNTSTQTTTDGSSVTVTTVPVVAGSRQDTNTTSGNADIPLVTSSGSTLLSAQVPAGYGLQVTGSTTPKTAGNSLTDLIREIKAHSEAGSSDQTQLTGGGSGFLGGLSVDTPLLVQTIVPTVAPGSSSAPNTPLVITGTPQASGQTQTALVIDTRSLPAGVAIELQNVDFAAVIGAVRITGGNGSQTVFGDSADQSMVLGADDDTLHGGGGNDLVGSKGGNDLLYGDAGDDTVFGGIGNDTLFGGGDQDLVYGNQDADLIYGNQGADSLYGGQGDDRAYGGQGEDQIWGNLGNDVLLGNLGADLVYGNQGADLIYGNQGSDTLYGGQDADTLMGGQDADQLFGNLGADIVYGNRGNDILYGGQGADTLYGGQGDDVLVGGLGDDVLVGGLGADLYVFGLASGRDLIVGFSQAAGDRIVLGGQGYTLGTAQNGDALLTLSGGGVVDLAGIRADQVNASFFVTA